MCPRHSRFGDLPGSISQFLILNTPLQPHRKAFPGSKSVILIRSPLSAALPGSDLAFPSPNAPSAPISEALSGANPAFLSPRALPDGLPGSISAVLSPNDTIQLLRNPSRDQNSVFQSRRPFPASLARVAGPEQERAALSAVADIGKPLPSPALRLRLSLHKVRLRRPLRHLPLSGAGA